MADTFATLVVTADTAPLARQIAASFGPGGEGMWTTPLSADGLDPATHYVSSGYIPEQFVYLVPYYSVQWVQPEGEAGEWVLTPLSPGDAVAVYGAAQAAGIACTQADIDALFAASDVTTQDPFPAFDRLGLKIVQTGDIP